MVGNKEMEILEKVAISCSELYLGNNMEGQKTRQVR
jgi:hypothetical protein